jgi:hypothetical protein
VREELSSIIHDLHSWSFTSTKPQMSYQWTKYCMLKCTHGASDSLQALTRPALAWLGMRMTQCSVVHMHMQVILLVLHCSTPPAPGNLTFCRGQPYPQAPALALQSRSTCPPQLSAQTPQGYLLRAAQQTQAAPLPHLSGTSHLGYLNCTRQEVLGHCSQGMVEVVVLGRVGQEVLYHLWLGHLRVGQSSTRPRELLHALGLPRHLHTRGSASWPSSMCW